MAVDNDTKLTKFKSATTIVTADYANSIFGGLYGSSEADNLAPDDPRVIGHVHDGINADGHVGKIDLVDHVDNQLLNINLADDAVTKRNVRETLYPSEAIPEYEIIGGSTYYYLDLGSVRADFPLIEDPVSPSGTPGIIRQRSEYYDGSPIVGVWGTATGRDFVFGSPTLDYTGTTEGNIRFMFDKSLGAFRAGGVTGTQWDEVNRGDGSAAFGLNTIASGKYSFVAGDGITVTGNRSAAFGEGNTIESEHGLASGELNTLNIGSEYSTVFGYNNSVTADASATLGGYENSLYGSSSLIGVSNNSQIGADPAVFFGGYSEVILAGDEHSISGATSYNLILNGYQNSATDSYAGAILNGDENSLQTTLYSSILNGSLNSVSGFASGKGGIGFYSTILNGSENLIDTSNYSTILSGAFNKIATSTAEYESDEYPDFSMASGNTAISYAYGQVTQSSGSFRANSTPFSSFPDGNLDVTIPEQGSSQTFTLTMFGNFQYSAANINAGLVGEQTFVANLDNNGADFSAGRPFRPRRGSCYSIKAIGALSFTEQTPSPARPPGGHQSIRHSIAFELHSGITVQEDGSIIYGTNSFLVTHDSRDIYGSGPVRIKAPGTTNLDDDFRIWFTHDPVNPTNQSSSVAAIIPAPGGAADHGFSFVVENRTPLGSTGVGGTLYGETLSVRLDVTELNTNVYYNPP